MSLGSLAVLDFIVRVRFIAYVPIVSYYMCVHVVLIIVTQWGEPG